MKHGNVKIIGTVLTIWAMRDQILTGPQAEKISALYFKHIDRIDSEKQKARTFSVWHLTWAISNMYRLGDETVQQALEDAYKDAEKRVDKNVITRVHPLPGFKLGSKLGDNFFDHILLGFAHSVYSLTSSKSIKSA